MSTTCVDCFRADYFGHEESPVRAAAYIFNGMSICEPHLRERIHITDTPPREMSDK